LIFPNGFTGWEEPIKQTVDKAREKELVYVRSLAITKALMIAIVLGSSVIAAVVTFSVYVALYPSEGMDPENIFVAAILINMLRYVCVCLKYARIHGIIFWIFFLFFFWGYICTKKKFARMLSDVGPF